MISPKTAVILIVIALSVAGITIVVQRSGPQDKTTETIYSPEPTEEEDGYNKDFFKDSTEYTTVKPQSLKKMGAKELDN